MICFGLHTDPNMCQKKKYPHHDTNTCLLLWHKPGESHGFILLMRYPDLAIRVSALGFVRTGSLQHVFEKIPTPFCRLCAHSVYCVRKGLSLSEGTETEHGLSLLLIWFKAWQSCVLRWPFAYRCLKIASWTHAKLLSHWAGFTVLPLLEKKLNCIFFHPTMINPGQRRAQKQQPLEGWCE